MYKGHFERIASSSLAGPFTRAHGYESEGCGFESHYMQGNFILKCYRFPRAPRRSTEPIRTFSALISSNV